MENLRGVNLGGWLVLEHLSTSHIFEGVFPRDETTFIEKLGERGKQVLRDHHNSYIKEDDFKWLADHGINAIRIPVPYWVFGDIEPYVSSIKTLDWAMDMAKKYKLQVLLDLHTAPGSQNGQDHSGKSGTVRWHTEPGNITRTVEVVERLALRYGKYPNLWGIELLNEPHIDIPLDILGAYYKLAYEKVRAVCDASVMIVMHDGFRPEKWGRFFAQNDFENIALDLHLYQVFAAEDKKFDIHKHLKKALAQRDLLEKVQVDVPVVIGEWSLGLPSKAFRRLDSWEADKARQAFGQIQINTYQKTLGWFFWTYKTDDPGGWNFRFCVEKGWLPPSFEKPLTIEAPT